jgi:hypothetical protein
MTFRIRPQILFDWLCATFPSLDLDLAQRSYETDYMRVELLLRRFAQHRHCEAPLGAEAIQSPRMDSAPAHAGVRDAKSAARNDGVELMPCTMG